MGSALVGWVTGVLLAVMVCGIGYALYETSRPEYQAREKVEKAERTAKTIARSRIYYAYDERTGLCFAAKTHWRGLGMANVPCTPKVKEMIRGTR